jgi:hypothetical protein
MMDLDWGDDEVTPKGRPTLAIPPNWMADPEICAMAAYAYYRIWKPNGKKHWRCMEEYFAQTFGFAIRADHFKRAGLVRSPYPSRRYRLRLVSCGRHCFCFCAPKIQPIETLHNDCDCCFCD